MVFHSSLADFEIAVLIALMMIELSGPIWMGLHGDPKGKWTFYIWPAVHFIVFILLGVALIQVLLP